MMNAGGGAEAASENAGGSIFRCALTLERQRVGAKPELCSLTEPKFRDLSPGFQTLENIQATARFVSLTCMQSRSRLRRSTPRTAVQPPQSAAGYRSPNFTKLLKQPHIRATPLRVRAQATHQKPQRRQGPGTRAQDREPEAAKPTRTCVRAGGGGEGRAGLQPPRAAEGTGGRRAETTRGRQSPEQPRAGKKGKTKQPQQTPSQHGRQRSPRSQPERRTAKPEEPRREPQHGTKAKPRPRGQDRPPGNETRRQQNPEEPLRQGGATAERDEPTARGAAREDAPGPRTKPRKTRGRSRDRQAHATQDREADPKGARREGRGENRQARQPEPEPTEPRAAPQRDREATRNAKNRAEPAPKDRPGKGGAAATATTRRKTRAKARGRQKATQGQKAHTEPEKPKDREAPAGPEPGTEEAENGEAPQTQPPDPKKEGGPPQRAGTAEGAAAGAGRPHATRSHTAQTTRGGRPTQRPSRDP